MRRKKKKTGERRSRCKREEYLRNSDGDSNTKTAHMAIPACTHTSEASQVPSEAHGALRVCAPGNQGCGFKKKKKQAKKKRRKSRSASQLSSNRTAYFFFLIIILACSSAHCHCFSSSLKDVKRKDKKKKRGFREWSVCFGVADLRDIVRIPLFFFFTHFSEDGRITTTKSKQTGRRKKKKVLLGSKVKEEEQKRKSRGTQKRIGSITFSVTRGGNLKKKKKKARNREKKNTRLTGVTYQHTLFFFFQFTGSDSNELCWRRSE